MPNPLPLLFLAALLAAEPVPEGDTVCGPRCVQTILRSYGHEVELIDLVRELHTDGVEKGTTLGQMRDALRQRGLHAEVVHLPAGATLSWPEPAILHLKPLPTPVSGPALAAGSPASNLPPAPQTLGHFIIHLGDDHGTTTIHDPLTGTLHGPREELLQSMSGDLLLISKTQISPATEFATAAPSPWQLPTLIICVVSALGALVGLWRSRKSPFRSQKPCPKSACSC